MGVPKTIDNDLGGTDMTFGFQTAVQIVSDAIDRLHTTAESHNRVMIVEVMGRGAGWIATHAGMSGGADAILVPERPFDIEALVAQLRRRHARGRTLLDPRRLRGRDAASEASCRRAPPPSMRSAMSGSAGSAPRSRSRSSSHTGYESRATILGPRPARRHARRLRPCPRHPLRRRRDGRRRRAGSFGTMVALRGTDIVEVPLTEALREPKLLDPALYETAELFFG